MENLTAWAEESYAVLNLTWKDAPAKPPAARVLGTTADKAALMDITARRGKVVRASAVMPVQPAYTPMLTLLLASLVDGATFAEADAFLARHLDRLPRKKPGEVAAPWHQWRVVLTTTSLGLLTMQVVRAR